MRVMRRTRGNYAFGIVTGATVGILVGEGEDVGRET